VIRSVNHSVTTYLTHLLEETMSKFSRFMVRNNAGIFGKRTGIKAIIMILGMVFSLIGLAPIPASAAGTTYIVNNTGGCSDTSTNTAVTPFCTIGKAASVAVAGDTVSVVAGTYAETVTPSNSGTSGNPIIYLGASGVVVTGDGTSTGSAFRANGLSYITINGFTVQNTAEGGIYVSGSNFIISNNTVTNTTNWGIYAPDSTNITISNNTVSLAGKATPAYESGIDLSNTSASTVSGNRSFNNTADGIRLSTCNNVTVSNNTTYGNNAVTSSDGNGIALINTSYSNTILHNKVYDNRDTGIQVDSGSHNNSIVGNLSYGNGDHGIDNNTAPNQTIVGNTFQGNFTSGINLELNSSGATVQDNILVDNGLEPSGGRKPYNIYVDETSYSGTTLDYNLYYLTSPYDQQIQWNTTGYTSVSAFHIAFPTQETHGSQGDPLFVSPAPSASDPPVLHTGDYHLQSGSPAIDSANSSASGEPATDLDGNARLDDPNTPNTGGGTYTYYDRGAYEFQPSSYPPSVTTQAVTAIGQTGATGNGTIVTLGSDNPTQHGVVWATSANPTLANNFTKDGPISAKGPFASAITGLSPSTQYHVRAYATNLEGTSYGGDVTFTTAAGHSDTYTSGSGSWLAPTGVTSVTVEVWGGGGKGYSISSGSGQAVGGGGGGGGYSESVVTVTPGNSYPYAVGAGSSSTAAGGSSSFNTSTVVANGGNSATSSSGASGAASGTGTNKYSGGDGANGSTGSNYGGGGGSSAGTAASGTDATSYSGATAPAGGGKGGDGNRLLSGNGSVGSTPGGAGGGAYRTSGSNSYSGGNGANGQVRITYGLVAGATTTSVVCGGGTPTVSYGNSITCVATVAASSGTPTGTVSWVSSSISFSFTTSPCTLSSGSCSVSYTPGDVGTGSHLITATYSGDTNYSASHGSQAVTVNPKALTTSGLSVASSKVYNGTISAVVLGTAVLQTPEIFVTGTSGDGKPYTTDNVSLTGTAVGSYNSKDVPTAATVTFSGLSLTGPQAANYTLTLQSPASATITTKALTMSGLSVPASKIYDGKIAAVVTGTAALQSAEATGGVGTTGDGKPYTGDTVSITGTALGAYNSKDVGVGTTVTFSGLSLAGGQAGDYSLTIQSPASATITPKALTMSGLSVPASKIYDGTPSAVVSGTGFLTGSESIGSGTSSDGKYYTGDLVSLTGTAIGTYNSKNVGIATTVTFSGFSLTGLQQGDYTLTNLTAPATITAKAITVTAVVNAKLYDGTTVAAAVPTNSGVVSGDTAAFIESYMDKNVGFSNKTLVPSGIVSDGNSGANYSYTRINFTTGTITAYPISVNAITNTKMYDGTTTAAAIPTNSGVIAGDTATFIEAYSNKNYGTGNKTLVPSGIVSDGNNGANYSYTFNPFTTGTITIKPITVTAITNTKVYDGLTSAAAIPTNSGLGTGDVANFIESYLDKNVGSGNKILVPSGSVTDGNGGFNYSYTMITFSTGSITAKPASVTAVDNSKTVGSGDPPLTTTNSGFIASELGVGKITFSATRAAGETVGTYSIIPSADDAGSGMLGNYNVALNHGTFTIIAKLIPTVTVACGTNSVTLGSSLSCTVSVVRPSGSGTPTGTVDWTTDGAGGFGATTPCTLSSSVPGTATCSATYTPTGVGTGTHKLTATYNGDAEFATNNGTRNVKITMFYIYLPIILR
jgi:parallel beta-helix repeat protein